MRDVLGPERLLGEAAFERGAQRRVAVGVQERVQPLDLGDPRARPSVRQLGEIRERRRKAIRDVVDAVRVSAPLWTTSAGLVADSTVRAPRG